MRVAVVLAATFTAAYCVLEGKLVEYTVAPVGKNSLVGLSGNLSPKFCQIDGKKCPKVSKKVRFTPVLNQCKALCLRHKGPGDCVTVFYNESNRTCHLKTERCTLDELEDFPNGVDLYRLTMDEGKCPPPRVPYKPRKSPYSAIFCGKTSSTCHKKNLYPFEWRFPTLLKCLQKCASVPTCGGATYHGKNKICDMKEKPPCEPKDLAPNEGTVHFFRLSNGVTLCPPDTEGVPEDSDIPYEDQQKDDTDKPDSGDQSDTTIAPTTPEPTTITTTTPEPTTITTTPEPTTITKTPEPTTVTTPEPTTITTTPEPTTITTTPEPTTVTTIKATDKPDGSGQGGSDKQDTSGSGSNQQDSKSKETAKPDTTTVKPVTTPMKPKSCVCKKGYIKEGCECIPLPKCPAHSTHSGTSCSCEEGYIKQGAECVPMVCPINSTPTCECDHDYVKIGHECVQSCPEHSSKSGKDCVCDTGYRREGAKCVQSNTCPEHSTKIGNLCICNSHTDGSGCVGLPDCPEHSVRSGTDCICEKGYVKRGDVCEKLPDYPENSIPSGSTFICTEGYVKLNDGCSKIPEPCQNGTVQTGLGCRCPPGYVSKIRGVGADCVEKSLDDRVEYLIDLVRPRQSPFRKDTPPEYAIDTDLEGEALLDTCSVALLVIQPPWWSADFEQPAIVTRIDVHLIPNFRSCAGIVHCGTSMVEVMVLVNHRVCVYRSENIAREWTFTCDKPTWGTQLTIQSIVAQKTLNLCHVAVFGYPSPKDPDPASQVCSGKTGDDEAMKDSAIRSIPVDAEKTEQSSTRKNFFAQLAVDEYKDHPHPEFRHMSWHKTCSRTSLNGPIEKAWWRTTFLQPAIVYAVYIYNRIDCCQEKLANFEVLVGDELCVFQKEWFKDRKLIPCDKPLCGNTLMIRLENTDHALSLCHVEILGKIIVNKVSDQQSCRTRGDGEELAFESGSARQLYDPAGKTAQLAFDGDKRKCAQTHSAGHRRFISRYEPLSWWSAKLEKTSLIQGVKILSDGQRAVLVLVDDQVCRYPEPNFPEVFVCDKPICGNTITIIMVNNNDGYVNLCEIVPLGLA